MYSANIYPDGWSCRNRGEQQVELWCCVKYCSLVDMCFLSATGLKWQFKKRKQMFYIIYVNVYLTVLCVTWNFSLQEPPKGINKSCLSLNLRHEMSQTETLASPELNVWLLMLTDGIRREKKNKIRRPKTCSRSLRVEMWTDNVF